MGIFLSFLPWIVFWVLSGRNNYQIATLAAAVVVISLNFRDIRQISIKILDLGTMIFFIILSGVSFSPNAVWIDHYSAPLSDGAMFFIALISLVIRKPFTLQYAYEQVDQKFWNLGLIIRTAIWFKPLFLFYFSALAAKAFSRAAIRTYRSAFFRKIALPLWCHPLFLNSGYE